MSDNFFSSDRIHSFDGTPPFHSSNTTSPCIDNSPKLIHGSPPLIKNSPPQCDSSNNESGSNKTDHNKANDIKADKDNNNTAASAEGNSKKLKSGRKHNDVWKCTENRNPEKLVLTTMKEDHWLTDEQHRSCTMAII